MSEKSSGSRGVTMKVTFKQWTRLEELAKTAQAALSDLQTQLADYAATHNMAGNEIETEFLIELAGKISDLSGSKEVIPYFYHPQPEWMGGDSDNPKNHKMREPHMVGSFPGYLDGSADEKSNKS